ncbi:b121 [miniopterid betaherpesvirus 1]|uniref:B121 n=1 Tax=miniopterid betaherpesvirus 1 TaxID=3070189 RepID=I3VQB1_9BETA|nr:b121 [miniopterid betaherpesvirus 1]AFK83955.1 b121 [miniopterid betaherpesvirus 1]
MLRFYVMFFGLSCAMAGFTLPKANVSLTYRYGNGILTAMCGIAFIGDRAHLSIEIAGQKITLYSVSAIDDEIFYSITFTLKHPGLFGLTLTCVGDYSSDAMLGEPATVAATVRDTAETYDLGTVILSARSGYSLSSDHKIFVCTYLLNNKYAQTFLGGHKDVLLNLESQLTIPKKINIAIKRPNSAEWNNFSCRILEYEHIMSIYMDEAKEKCLV